MRGRAGLLLLGAMGLGLGVGCGPGDATMRDPAAALRVPSRATTEQENLEAFARLYGYVRWFHPTDAAARANWRVLAATGIASVREAQDLGELREALQEHFGPLAPRLELWLDGEPPPDDEPAPDPKRAVYWQHEGYVGTRLSLYSPPYGQVRVGKDGPYRRRFAQAPDPDTRVQTQLLPGLHLRLPTVLTAADAEHDGDVSTSWDDELAHAAVSAHGWKQLDVRQGAVVEVWNVLRHFYPYQDTVPIDFDALLVEALHDAQDDASVDDVAGTLWHLVHALQDGHGMVGHRELAARGQLPLRVELIEGEPVVTGTADPEHFAVGDVIESIDGVPLLPRVHALTERLSGSPQWRRFRAASWEALAGPRDAAVPITVRSGKRSHTETARYDAAAPPVPPRPPALHRFDDGTWYVDLTRAHWQDLEPALPELALAPGVVFDMRGYPTDTHRILAHLMAVEEDAQWMHVPRVLEPDGHVAGWGPIGWHIRPAEPQIPGKRAFLIDAEAISYAESVLGYVEAHDLGPLVGSPTAGANGDIVRVDTLGGFYVVFTGMKVTHHDGRRLHGDGIAPNIAVTPTRAGLRAGKDEVLQAGLAQVRDRRIARAPRPRADR